MTTIQLQGDISFEQYQMAVSALENIGLEVEKTALDTQESNEGFVLSEEQKRILDSRSKRASFRDADEVFAELELKYEL